MTERDADVVVVGAGASGLGAEFIHGSADPIREVAARHHVATLDISDHRMVGSFADALRANRKRLSPTDRALATQFVEGFDAADAADISERALAESGSPGDDVREARIGRVLSFDRMSFVLARDRDLPFSVWWTAYPIRAPMLVAWLGGPAAARMSTLPTDVIEGHAVASLATVFGMAPRTVRRLLVRTFHHDWGNDPFSRGAYSYSRVGGHRAPQNLAKSVDDTIWFAGEATSAQQDIGTVHGAIASGWRAARQVLRRR